VRRSWRVMSALALVLAAGSMFLSARLFAQVQQERERSVVAGCLRDSAQSAAIIQFLGDVGSRKETLALARVLFPVLTEEQCRARGRDSVGNQLR
jgi:hypothetical protein